MIPDKLDQIIETFPHALLSEEGAVAYGDLIADTQTAEEVAPRPRRVTTRFGHWHVTFDPDGRVSVLGLDGNQTDGTLLCQQELQPGMGPWGTADWVTLTQWFAPALSRYEPETRNRAGDLGAYRSIPDADRVAALTTQLEEAHP